MGAGAHVDRSNAMMGKPKAALRRAARVTIACPHCGGATRIGNSKTHDRMYRQIYYACLDVECGHTFSADLVITHTISPSACPDPDVKLRVVPTRHRAALTESPDACGLEVPPPSNDLLGLEAARGG